MQTTTEKSVMFPTDDFSALELADEYWADALLEDEEADDDFDAEADHIYSAGVVA
jgi:hypothetical protein